jgi:serine/threonine protein kinase
MSLLTIPNNHAEYGCGSNISTEGDVYSYGIVVLELLTGKRPTDEMFNDGLSLHKFVEVAFPHRIGEILDPSCMVPNFEDDGADNDDSDNGKHATDRMISCVMQLAKIGLSCSTGAPKDRPTMKDVYAEVVTITEAFSALCG